MVFVQVAVELVGAALRYELENTAAASNVSGRLASNGGAELLNGVYWRADGGSECRTSRDIVDVHAVKGDLALVGAGTCY